MAIVRLNGPASWPEETANHSLSDDIGSRVNLRFGAHSASPCDDLTKEVLAPSRRLGRFALGGNFSGLAVCYFGAARATVWQRAGPEDVSPAAQPSSSLLIGGTRAPFFRTTRLPSADELFVGIFSVTRDIDLPIA